MSESNFSDRFRLDGKVALVTAAGGGFGSVISKGLAQQGADVVVTDLNEDALGEVDQQVKQCGRRSLALSLDVSDLEQIDETVARVVGEMGQIDILVNVACNAVLNPVLEMSAEDFDSTIATCLRGAFFVSRAVGQVMVDQGRGGSMVHISSIASARALGRGTGIYAAAKAGVNAMVRELAVEWASHSIRVNAIAPCQFRTESFERVLNDPRHGGCEHLTKKMTSRIPIGRFGEPEEIAAPTIFLVSDASSMVTGHVLFLDGGYMAS